MKHPPIHPRAARRGPRRKVRLAACFGAWLLAALAMTPDALADDVPGAAAGLRGRAGAPPSVRRLGVRITAASGGSVYLDKGREAGLQAGDTVLLYPPGAAAVEAIIASVSRRSSRVEVPPGAPTLGVDDRGEVLVPLSRDTPPAAPPAPQDGSAAPTTPGDAPPATPPDHPEWTAPPEDWDHSQPLLAPAFSRTPEEKPTLLRGRVYFLGQNNWDEEHGSSEFTSARLGTEVFVDNPFHKGGQLHFDGETNLRRTVLDDDSDQTIRSRIDRLSYAWGGTREEPLAVEVGRFLQNEFPEFGVLDGVETTLRTEHGGRIGASFGYMPEPFPRMETGKDLQVALYYRTDSGDPRDVILGVATQATWHEGDADRNLFVGTLDWNPTDELSFYGAAWVDYYGAEDDIKTTNLQLTNLRLNGVYRIAPGTGVGAHVSQSRWPELLSNEFASATAEEILDNETTRVGVSAWHELSEHVRLDTRLDRWEDQNDTGGSGNVRIALRDLLYERGEVAVDVFRSIGSYTDTTGLRLSANRSFGDGTFAVISWETAENDNEGADVDDANLDQQTLRASLDMMLDLTRSLSIFVERRTGDEQDSKNLGVFFQQRF